MAPKELSYNQKISALNYMQAIFEGHKRKHDFLCNLLDQWRVINWPFESAFTFKCFTHNRNIAFPEFQTYVNENLTWNKTLGTLRDPGIRLYAIQKIREKVQQRQCTDICFLADPSFPGGAIYKSKQLEL